MYWRENWRGTQKRASRCRGCDADTNPIPVQAMCFAWLAPFRGGLVATTSVWVAGAGASRTTRPGKSKECRLNAHMHAQTATINTVTLNAHSNTACVAPVRVCACAQGPRTVRDAGQCAGPFPRPTNQVTNLDTILCRCRVKLQQQRRKTGSALMYRANCVFLCRRTAVCAVALCVRVRNHRVGRAWKTVVQRAASSSWC